MSASCGDVREAAPELALGVLTGAERADALTHLEHCAACRAVVADLAATAEQLVLAAPEATPPPGFEARVLDRLGAQQRGRRRSLRRTIMAVAAIVAASTVISVATVRILDARSPSNTAAVQAPSDRLRSATMVGGQGMPAGRAFAYGGDPGWLVVTVEYGIPAGTYGVELVPSTAAATGTRVGDMVVTGGGGTWGGAARLPVAGGAVRLVDARGQVVCEARFGPTTAAASYSPVGG